MSYYNEADTRAKLIDTKIKLSGWGEGFIEREHYFVKGQTVTASIMWEPPGFLMNEILLLEATFLVEATGVQLTLAQYFDYTEGKIMDCTPNCKQLHEIWTNFTLWQAFLEELETESVHLEVIAEVLAQPRADQFDLLAHIAYGKPVHTRDERVEAFLNYEQQFLQSRSPEA